MGKLFVITLVILIAYASARPDSSSDESNSSHSSSEEKNAVKPQLRVRRSYRDYNHTYGDGYGQPNYNRTGYGQPNYNRTGFGYGSDPGFNRRHGHDHGQGPHRYNKTGYYDHDNQQYPDGYYRNAY